VMLGGRRLTKDARGSVPHRVRQELEVMWVCAIAIGKRSVWQILLC
jgi:hypothetical protein